MTDCSFALCKNTLFTLIGTKEMFQFSFFNSSFICDVADGSILFKNGINYESTNRQKEDSPALHLKSLFAEKITFVTDKG